MPKLSKQSGFAGKAAENATFSLVFFLNSNMIANRIDDDCGAISPHFSPHRPHSEANCLILRQGSQNETN